jgi:hypothetical protein
MPRASSVARIRSCTSNSGSPKNRFELDDRAQQHADRRLREPAVLLEHRLALVRGEELQGGSQIGEVEQRQPLVVAVGEDQGQHRDLGLVQVEHLAEQDRAERRDGRSHLSPELARQREQLDRVGPGLVGEAELGSPFDDRGRGRIPGLRDAREVALHVAHEDRDTRVGQLSGEDL